MNQLSGALAKGIKAVGYIPNEDRPAFKMAIHEVEGKWYLYCAHFWHSGWSITDITDPAAPSCLLYTSPSPRD